MRCTKKERGSISFFGNFCLKMYVMHGVQRKERKSFFIFKTIDLSAVKNTVYGRSVGREEMENGERWRRIQ